jgi:hypothetical protein
LRSIDALPVELRASFRSAATPRTQAEAVVTVPIPGLWLSQQPAQPAAGEDATPVTDAIPGEEGRDRRLGGRWRSGGGGAGRADSA